MKFINYLESITGIGVYPMISFILFFVFFLIISIYAFAADKKHFHEISEIPLDLDRHEKK